MKEQSYPFLLSLHRISDMAKIVLPDYQGIGVGKRLLNFIAELYSSQTKIPFYLLTSHPQIIRGNLANWKVKRFGHASKGQENTPINNEIRNSLSRNRVTVSLQFLGESTLCAIKKDTLTLIITIKSIINHNYTKKPGKNGFITR